MGESTGISWTGSTFNPWVGCQRVSPGCEHCYAEALDKRMGGAAATNGAEKQLRWGPKAPRTRTSASNWRQPIRWNAVAAKIGKRHRVFCASLADVFEDRPELVQWRSELFDLIAGTPWLDWQILTKRPQNIMGLWPGSPPTTPAPNIWIGTTVEDQERAELRIPHLLAVPAAVRFVSCEPLLERVDLSKWLWPMCWHWDSRFKTPEEALASGAMAMKKPQSMISAGRQFLDWVIVGGESGSGARPFDLDWARQLRQQVGQSKAAFFMKQMGDRPFHSSEPHLIPAYGRHGADIQRWPEFFRAQEFPR